MPTYQYACTECGHQFETVQSFSEDALTDCPQCTGRLRKVFNAVGIVFKGSGFYRNDSRKTASNGAGSSVRGDPWFGISVALHAARGIPEPMPRRSHRARGSSCFA